MAPSSSPAVAVLAAALGCTGLLALGPTATQSPRPNEGLRSGDVEALAAGRLLIASRRLPDSKFSKTVILLADFNHDGALGLVVNRRSDVTVARVFPSLMPTVASAGYAFLGGPVAKTDVLALVRAAAAPALARQVMDGVYLLPSRAELEALIGSGATSSRVRVYLGYAGWGPGQLEAETEQGAWHVLAGDADIVFDPDPAATWQRQILRTEVIQARRLEAGTRARPST